MMMMMMMVMVELARPADLVEQLVGYHHCGHHLCEHGQSSMFIEHHHIVDIIIVTIKSHRSGHHHQSHNHYGDLHSQELMNNFHWGHSPSPNYLSIWLSDLMIYAQNNMLMSFESRFSF